MDREPTPQARALDLMSQRNPEAPGRAGRGTWCQVAGDAAPGGRPAAEDELSRRKLFDSPPTH